MTKAEIDQAEAEAGSKVKLMSGDVVTTSATIVQIGETSSTTFFRLSMDMALYDLGAGQTGRYHVYSHAGWESKWQPMFNEGKDYPEHKYFDFISVNWGGGLTAYSYNANGNYYSGNNNLSIAPYEADSYKGILWQFNERAGWTADNVQNANCHVYLKPAASPVGRETNAKMTYIHTYGKFNEYPSISVKFEGDIIQADVIFKENVKSWQVQLDVEGLPF